MMGRPGKCPTHQNSLSVTFLTPTALSLSTMSVILSISKNGSRCGSSCMIRLRSISIVASFLAGHFGEHGDLAHVLADGNCGRAHDFAARRNVAHDARLRGNLRAR